MRSVEQKRGTDHGIDGKILFRDDPKASKAEQIIIQVKGNKPSLKDLRDLRGVLDREKAAMGILISLQPPTRDIVVEAVGADFCEHKTIQELTHCITGIYILLSPPANRKDSAIPPPP
jgi:hypothetical protein